MSKVIQADESNFGQRLWNTTVVLSLCQQGNITAIEAAKVLGWRYIKVIKTLERLKQDRIIVWRSMSRMEQRRH